MAEPEIKVYFVTPPRHTPVHRDQAPSPCYEFQNPPKAPVWDAELKYEVTGGGDDAKNERLFLYNVVVAISWFSTYPPKGTKSKCAKDFVAFIEMWQVNSAGFTATDTHIRGEPWIAGCEPPPTIKSCMIESKVRITAKLRKLKDELTFGQVKFEGSKTVDMKNGKYTLVKRVGRSFSNIDVGNTPGVKSDEDHDKMIYDYCEALSQAAENALDQVSVAAKGAKPLIKTYSTEVKHCDPNVPAGQKKVTDPADPPLIPAGVDLGGIGTEPKSDLPGDQGATPAPTSPRQNGGSGSDGTPNGGPGQDPTMKWIGFARGPKQVVDVSGGRGPIIVLNVQSVTPSPSLRVGSRGPSACECEGLSPLPVETITGGCQCRAW